MPNRFYSALKSSGKSINQTIRNQETTVAGERALRALRGRCCRLSEPRVLRIVVCSQGQGQWFDAGTGAI